MQFESAEEKDGIRMSWNIWPKTKAGQMKLVLPIGCLYSPLKDITGLNRVQAAPVFCKGPHCSGILNPFCQVDFANKIWVCPFCFSRNHFPISYNDISPENIPPELKQSHSTIEYCIQSKPFLPVFVFIIDTCMPPSELDALKESLLQSFLLLPENALVGLITFGKNVQIHELGFQECPRCYAFKGSSETRVDGKRMAELLGLPREDRGTARGRFLVSVSECEFVLTTLLEDLENDPWEAEPKQRPARCTGKAMEHAISLLEISEETKNGRIMLFTGGPATTGLGAVVGLELQETIRSHRDIFKGDAKKYDSAQKFYADLSLHCTKNNLVVDIFACALDQVGFAEMKVLVEKTGGHVVLCESFAEETFRESFRKVFSTSGDGMEMTFAGELEVNTSREFKLAGAIGPMSAYKCTSKNFSESLSIGLSGTNHWGIGSIGRSSTFAIYFDICNLEASAIPENRLAYVQFLTKYKRSVGQTLLRVATMAIEFADAGAADGFDSIKAGFDQSAACVLMARWAVFKAENEFAADIFRWLDSTLIRLIKTFSRFEKNNAESFRLSSEFSFYPQFMFYLRRSPFMNIFNSSPDETAYYRIVLVKENTLNSITMIQPPLFSYDLESNVRPVIPDIQSCQPDCILLLDSFFNVVVWYGRDIADWNRQNIQAQADYAYFGELLKKVSADAEKLKGGRIPHPPVIVAEENSSKARHLVAKLNPSVSYQNGYDEAGSQPVFTDDVSLNVFMAHLRNVVVEKE